MLALRAVLAAVLLSLTACGAVEKAAANDPLKCERNPKCQDKRGNYNDCATACSDNPDCMDRCQQVNGKR